MCDLGGRGVFRLMDRTKKKEGGKRRFFWGRRPKEKRKVKCDIVNENEKRWRWYLANSSLSRKILFRICVIYFRVLDSQFSRCFFLSSRFNDLIILSSVMFHLKVTFSRSIITSCMVRASERDLPPLISISFSGYAFKYMSHFYLDAFRDFRNAKLLYKQNVMRSPTKCTRGYLDGLPLTDTHSKDHQMCVGLHILQFLFAFDSYLPRPTLEQNKNKLITILHNILSL